MRFIGQNHIMNQLGFILPDLYLNPSRGANILLSGPSGFGKTTMAFGMCNYLAGKDFELYLYDREKFRFNKHVIFIDEIHKMKDLEILYPMMDEKSHVLILATNQDAILPEAFVNRTWQFTFSDYDDEELELICRSYSHIGISDDGFKKIILAGNRNPRIIKSLLDRISLFLSRNSVNPSTADYDHILESVFDIKDGMDTLCRRYIEILEEFGGNASLSLLKSALHVDEGTLRNTVEPVLLRKGVIRISQKGRCLTNVNF